MRAQESCETGKTDSTPSNRWTQIFVVALTLLGLGLIPIVYSPDGPEAQNIVPKETNLSQSN